MPSHTTVTRVEKSRDKSIKTDEALKWQYLGKFKTYSVCRQDIKNSDEVVFHLGHFGATLFHKVASVEMTPNKRGGKILYVDYVYVNSAYRGKKFATKLYHYLITEHDYTVVSGSSQSPGGRHIWRELSKYKDINIFVSKGDSCRPSVRKFVNGAYEARNEDEEDIDNNRFVAKKKTVRTIQYL